MDIARQKLEKHRNKALNNGTSASEYAAVIGVSPQRLAKIIAGTTEPTLREALALQSTAKIKPASWID